MNGQNNQHPKKEISPEAKQQFIMTVVNTAILVVIYFGSSQLNSPLLSMIVTFGYWIALGALLIAYLIYNRGFTRKGVTEEMLPADWSQEKKAEYIEDAKRRASRSKWMISVMLQLLITILLDAVYLFTWPIVQNLFE